MPHLCDEWGPYACEVHIDPPNLDVRGDFFVVRGRVTNRLSCTLLMMHYRNPDHPPMRQDIFM